MPGEQRYKVLKRIDAGGMAEVFLGEAESLQGFKKQVAIKRVLPHLAQNRKFMAMFLDEARLSLHLNHANVVQTFDIGVADNTYFIVMEYVDGCNLKVILDVAEQASLARSLLDTLEWLVELEEAEGHFETALGHQKRHTEVSESLFDEQRAQAIVEAVRDRTGVAGETRKPSREAAPPLFDLTALQRDANARFSWSARRTLRAAPH